MSADLRAFVTDVLNVDLDVWQRQWLERWEIRRPVQMWEIGVCRRSSHPMSPQLFRDALYVLNRRRYERLSGMRSEYRRKAKHR